MKYAIIIEEGESNYGAYAPDIPGCIGLGSTPERARKDLLDGLAGHLRLMAQDGDAMPTASSTVDYIDVEVPRKAAKRRPKPRRQPVP